MDFPIAAYSEYVAMSCEAGITGPSTYPGLQKANGEFDRTRLDEYLLSLALMSKSQPTDALPAHGPDSLHHWHSHEAKCKEIFRVNEAVHNGLVTLSEQIHALHASIVSMEEAAYPPPDSDLPVGAEASDLQQASPATGWCTPVTAGSRAEPRCINTQLMNRVALQRPLPLT